jgi:hypothetical protein
MRKYSKRKYGRTPPAPDSFNGQKEMPICPSSRLPLAIITYRNGMM